KILAPQRAVGHPGLGQGRIEIEHSDKARPLPAPVRDRKDWTAVRVEPVQNVMAVLPDGLNHDQRSIRRQSAEYFHPALLTIDEPVALCRIARMATPHFAPFATDGVHNSFFGLRLRGPATLVG